MSNADFVIVGAGSAGCALAARLTEDSDARVVVLEAGGPDTPEVIHHPPRGRRCGARSSTGRTRRRRSPVAPDRSTSGRAARCRRIEQPQRHGLHPRQPRGLRRVGVRRLRRLGPRVAAAALQAHGGRPRRRSGASAAPADRSSPRPAAPRTRSRRPLSRPRVRRAIPSPRTSTASASRAPGSTTC